MDHAESYMGFENLQGHGGLWPGCQRGGWYDHSCLFYSHLLQVPPGILETSRLKKRGGISNFLGIFMEPKQSSSNMVALCCTHESRSVTINRPLLQACCFGPSTPGCLLPEEMGLQEVQQPAQEVLSQGTLHPLDSEKAGMHGEQDQLSKEPCCTSVAWVCCGQQLRAQSRSPKDC